LGYLRTVALSGSQILVSGDVQGSIGTDTFYNTVLAVGVEPGPDGVYFTADDIAQPTGGTIKALYIGWYNRDNQLRPHGVIAQAIRSLKLGRHRVATSAAPWTWQDGDMRVTLIRRVTAEASGSARGV
jgi:hypothetical protein